MIKNDFPRAELVDLAGGPAHFARELSVASSTMSLWKQGRDVLGSEKQKTLLKRLGVEVETGELSSDVVHTWYARRPSIQLPAALRWACPLGGEVRVADWSHFDLTLKRIKLRLRMQVEVMVVRSGARAIVIRTDPGLVPRLADLGEGFRWFAGAREATLHIEAEKAELWRSGRPGWLDLESAWTPADPEPRSPLEIWRAAGFTDEQLTRLAEVLASKGVSPDEFRSMLESLNAGEAKEGEATR